jgi:fatty acid desaturase
MRTSYIMSQKSLPGSPNLSNVASTAETRNWSEFKKTLTPRYLKVWADISYAYVMLGLGLGLVYYFSLLQIGLPATVLATLVSALWIGFWHANLNLFMHEASHYHIHPVRKKNDTLANWFITSHVCQDIKSYRHSHWQHHLNLGRHNDPEFSYFNYPSLKFALRLLLGVQAIHMFLHRKNVASKLKSKDSSKQFDTLIRFVIIQLTVLVLAIALASPAVAIAWFIGLFGFFPFFNAIRQILEHRSISADPRTDYSEVDHGPVNRMFGDRFFARIFGGAGFNRHLLHHWDPEISYTRLADMEKFFMYSSLKCAIEESRASYWTTLVQIVRQGK